MTTFQEIIDKDWRGIWKTQNLAHFYLDTKLVDFLSVHPVVGTPEFAKYRSMDIHYHLETIIKRPTYIQIEEFTPQLYIAVHGSMENDSSFFRAIDNLAKVCLDQHLKAAFYNSELELVATHLLEE